MSDKPRYRITVQNIAPTDHRTNSEDPESIEFVFALEMNENIPYAEEWFSIGKLTVRVPVDSGTYAPSPTHYGRYFTQAIVQAHEDLRELSDAAQEVMLHSPENARTAS